MQNGVNNVCTLLLYYILERNSNYVNLSKRKLLPIGKRKIYIFFIWQLAYLHNVNTVSGIHLVDVVAKITNIFYDTGRTVVNFWLSFNDFNLGALELFSFDRSFMCKSHKSVPFRFYLVEPARVESTFYSFQSVIGLPATISFRDYLIHLANR